MAGRKPKTQWYGGSEGAYESEVRAREQRARWSRTDAEFSGKKQEEVAKKEALQMRGLAIKAGNYADQLKSDSATSARYAMAGAGRLEELGNRAAADYQQTSQAQFAAQQDANQRAALAIGASGGASGVRSALAASSQANAQAATQSAMLQAQELNQIRAQQQGAAAQSAQLYGGIAGMQGQLGQNAASQQFQAQAASSGTLTETAAARAAASQQNRQFDQQMVNDVELAQLNARREREGQFQAWKANATNRWTGGILG